MKEWKLKKVIQILTACLAMIVVLNVSGISTHKKRISGTNTSKVKFIDRRISKAISLCQSKRKFTKSLLQQAFKKRNHKRSPLSLYKVILLKYEQKALKITDN